MAKPQLSLLVLTVVAFAGAAGRRAKGLSSVRLTAVTPAVIHGEGPHYAAQQNALYFVDIMGNYVNKYDIATGVTTQVQLPTNVTLVVPVKGCENQFVVGIGKHLSLLKWDGQSTSYELTVMASVDEGKPYNRFNDGKADGAGCLLAGTMGREIAVGVVEPYQGTLYKLDEASKAAVPVIKNVSISNGIAWTEDDRTMYYIDSEKYEVVSFPYDVDAGAISAAGRKTVYTMDPTGKEGMPDGMTIDSNGNLWIAVFNGGKVLNVDPRTGQLLRALRMPAQRVTSAAWGGPQLADLYVTTSRMGLTEEQLQQQPLAGCVIRVAGLGVHGRPANAVTLSQCS